MQFIEKVILCESLTGGRFFDKVGILNLGRILPFNYGEI